MATVYTPRTKSTTNFTAISKSVPAAVTFDSYSETNKDNVADLSNSSGTTQWGTTFTPAFTGVVTSAKFYLAKVASPTGNMTVNIYNLTGSAGFRFPTGTALATSTAIDASTLSTSFNLITFTFPSTSQANLIAGVEYGIVVDFSTGSAANRVSVGVDFSSPTNVGNYINFSGGYFTGAGVGVCFYALGTQGYATPVKNTKTMTSQTKKTTSYTSINKSSSPTYTPITKN